MNFKVGDKVKYIGNTEEPLVTGMKGTVAKIISYNNTACIGIDFKLPTLIHFGPKYWNELEKIDNKPGINNRIVVSDKICECGKEKHGFASHSDWCPMYKKEK